MKFGFLISIIIAISTTTVLAQTTPESKFWNWFQENELMLFDFEKDQEQKFDKLSQVMKEVHQNLTFEFGPVLESGKREFIISANGMIGAFPKVESLFEAAPSNSKFIFKKFLPRRTPIRLSYEGTIINAEDVSCKLYKFGDEIGIMMFFDQYKESEKNIWGGIGFLMLDQALGEYDAGTKVRYVEFTSKDSEYFNGAFPLTELSERFDNNFKKKP